MVEASRGQTATTAVACVTLVTIAAVSGFSSLVLISTLGLVVVVSGLLLTPRHTMVVATVAVALAVPLAVREGLDDSPYRVINVVLGSALGLTISATRAASVARIERLRRQESALLAATPDAVVMLGSDGRVLQANDALRTLVPDAHAEVVLHEHLRHVRADGTPCSGGCPLAGVLAQGSHVTVQGDRVGPDGRPVDYVAVRDDDEIVVSLRDATERLLADRERAVAMQTAVEAREQSRVLDELGTSLRPVVPTVPGLDIDVWSRSSDVYSPAGGDLVDVSVLPDGRVLMIIVDALGHGVSSARDAWKVLYVSRSFLHVGLPLGEVVERTATTLASDAHPPHATLLAATLDPRTGVVSVAGGGHPPPLVVRASSGATEWIDVPGRGVGSPQPGSDSTMSTTLQSGDCLVLYTDGLVEATRDVVAGLLGMRASAVALRREPADGWAQRLVESVLPSQQVPDDSIVLFTRRHEPATA
jgi:PAS domain-containing protein